MHPSRSLSLSWILGVFCAGFVSLNAEVNKVEQVAEGVYFHEGDLGRRGHSNNGWIQLADYVIVIDGNFPSGAQYVIPKIKATTSKPMRFAFDTHHHGDHAYGNQIWFENGAIAVAHAGVIEEMKRYETGYFGGEPGRWEGAAENRPGVAASKLLPPSVLFEDKLIFDDGERRVELRHFGTAHTHGDGFAWLPKERILFTGDACVNGPYNYVGDGNTEEWIETLERAKQLKPRVICPGHGPIAGPELLDHQQTYFRKLRHEVGLLVQGGASEAEVLEQAPIIKVKLRQVEGLNKYIGTWFDGQLSKIYQELSE